MQAEIIIKAGMQIFPNNAYVLILYSNLLIDVMESTQTGYSQLQAAKKCNPNIMERFAIFVREQVRWPSSVRRMQQSPREWLHPNGNVHNTATPLRASVMLPPQEHMQRSAGAKSGESSVDLVSYVEYQRNHK